jgi:hypothetical protein
MEFRDFLSRLKKRVKYRLTLSKFKPNKTGADVGGESADPTGPRLGSDPHVITGGVNEQETRAGVDGREVEQTHSHLHPVDVEVAKGSGPAETPAFFLAAMGSLSFEEKPSTGLNVS